MEACSIHIPFTLEPGEGSYENNERFTFWSSPSTTQWFKTRGYTLYERIWNDSDITDGSFPIIPSEVAVAEAKYPYAHLDTETAPPPDTPMPLCVFEMTGKVGYAQDSLGRHVAIKVIRAETDEYRMLQFLKLQEPEILSKNCVIPVIELLPNEGFWFAVMPR